MRAAAMAALVCVSGLTGPSAWAVSPDASALLDPTGAGNLHAVHEAVTPTTDASHLLVATTPARQGDLADFMRNGWPIRVAVPYSRTFFWVDPQGVHGMVPALMRGLADHLQRCGPEGCALPTLQFVPMPLDQMEQALEDGRAEIAAGGLVMVPGWERVAAFTCPVLTDVDLCVVRGPHARAVERIEDLSGRTVVVARGRAADDVLAQLRPAFQQRQLAPPQVEYAPDRLGMEEVLELVVAGTYEYTVMPRPLVAALARNLPGLEATPVNVAVNQQTACAVRRQMPALVQALNGFIQSSHVHERAERMLAGAAEYGADPVEHLSQPAHAASTSAPADPASTGSSGAAPATARQRLALYAPLFVKHGRQFKLQPVRVAAQAYQESHFDPRARSGVGAMGLMQLMPATAKELGVTDPYDPDQNVHGGCKYMDWLHHTYFNDPRVAPDDQFWFCLAAYNAGAGNVRKWRQLAAQRGLDPDTWFGSVERVALANGVRQTVTYVSNISKYQAQFAATPAMRNALD